MTRRGGYASAVATYVTLFGAVGVLYPYLPVYYGSRGFGVREIGLLAAGYAAAAMLAAPVWGAIADRSGTARPVLSVAAGVAAAAAVALALAGDAAQLAVAVIALSLAMAGIAPILDARAMEVVDARPARYGRLRVWGSASFIVVVVGTGRLVEAAGIRAMFAVLGGALVATAVIGAGIRPRSTSAESRRRSLGSVTRSAVLMPFFAAILLAWTAATAINAFFSVHLAAVGAPPSLIGVSWAIGAAVEVPIMIAFPQLERRVGRRRLLLIGASLFVVRALALVLIDDPALVALTMLVHGAAFALVLVGGVLYVAEHTPPGAAASAQGVLAATVFGLAQVLGPGIGGLVGGAMELRAMFGVAGIGSAVAVGALALLLTRPATSVPPVPNVDEPS